MVQPAAVTSSLRGTLDAVLAGLPGQLRVPGQGRAACEARLARLRAAVDQPGPAGG